MPKLIALKPTLIFLFLLASTFIITSCKKDDVSKSADIYLAGSVYKSNGTINAAYWKNSILVELNSGAQRSELSSIVVSNNIVYALGHEDFSKLILWKNGERIVIAENLVSCFPKGLVVKGNDVYVLADVYKDDTKANSIPTVYKNGSPIELTDGSVSTTSTGLAVNNNGVYVSGRISQNNVPRAVVWKDKELINLSDGIKSVVAEAITVKGNDVYIAGTGQGSKAPVGLVWKNMGKADTLINPAGYAPRVARVSSIVVDSENNVYVAGVATDLFTTSTTIYYLAWKNGDMGKTPVSTGSINDGIGAAAYFNNELYVAGVINGRIGYWKNNEPLVITEQPGSVVAVFIDENGK